MKVLSLREMCTALYKNPALADAVYRETKRQGKIMSVLDGEIDLPSEKVALDWFQRDNLTYAPAKAHKGA